MKEIIVFTWFYLMIFIIFYCISEFIDWIIDKQNNKNIK